MSDANDPDVLAALAAARRLGGAAFDPARIADELVRRVEREVARGTVRVDVIQAEDTAPLSDVDAGRLRDAWHRGVSRHRAAERLARGLRLQIETASAGVVRPMLAGLAGAEGVDALSLVRRDLHGPHGWSWPLRVRAIGGEARHGLDSYAHPALLDVESDPERATSLLVVQDLAFLDDEASGQRTGLLLVFVDSDEAMAAAERGELGLPVAYRALAVVRRPDDLPVFMHRFLDELAHDLNPDVALAHAVPDPADYLVVGDPAFLDEARISVALGDLERELESELALGRMDRGDFAEGVEAIREIHRIRTGLFHREGDEATDGARATRHTRDFIEERSGPVRSARRTTRSARPGPGERAARPDPGPAAGAVRHLQAQLYAHLGGDWVQRRHSLEPGTDHRLVARIGLADVDWIQVDTPFPEPDFARTEARLTMTLVAPGLLERPISREVLLPKRGASSVAVFEFSVESPSDPVGFTLLVHHRGKHLQTAVLAARVVPGDPDSEEMEFLRYAPARTDTAHQSDIDMSMWKQGDVIVLKPYDPDAAPDEPSHPDQERNFAGIDTELDQVREELFEAAKKLSWLGGGIDDDALTFLRHMAERGEDLRRRLFADDPLDGVRRIQFSSPYSADSFPLEFLYDHPLPDEDAPLCPDFKATPPARPGPAEHPVVCRRCSVQGGRSEVVCPSGFWGLNRVIERQVRPADASCHQPESSDATPGPLRMEKIVFAAADEVNGEDPDCVDDTLAALGGIAAVEHAESWNRWSELVTESDPALLVALPHNLETTPFQKLRIAADQDLALNRIRQSHVAPQGSPIGSPILLFACNSANPDVRYHDFIARLRCLGAPLVVGTITYVLGTQAAAVAREFATQLWGRRGTTTSGEVLRSVREAMLKDDNVMALALVAYGDADWLI